MLRKPFPIGEVEDWAAGATLDAWQWASAFADEYPPQLNQLEKDQQMEVEFQELRRQQDKDLRELDKARQEMEKEIENELSGKLKTSWNGRVEREP